MGGYALSGVGDIVLYNLTPQPMYTASGIHPLSIHQPQDPRRLDGAGRDDGTFRRAAVGAVHVESASVGGIADGNETVSPVQPNMRRSANWFSHVDDTALSSLLSQRS